MDIYDNNTKLGLALTKSNKNCRTFCIVSGTAGRHLIFRDNPASFGTVGKYDYGQLKKLHTANGNSSTHADGHTHSKRFFYTSEECVSLNIF